MISLKLLMIWCDVIDSGQVHPSFSNTMFGGVWIWQYRLPSWLQAPQNIFVLTLFLVQTTKIKKIMVCNCATWNRQSMTINKKTTGWRGAKQAELPQYKQVEELSQLSFLPFFRTARNHDPQTKQQTKPWDKMRQHVTSCLKLSKEIHYCKW